MNKKALLPLIGLFLLVTGIIRKTKCFDFWERNVLFPKTKRFFFAPLNTPYPALFRLISHF